MAAIADANHAHTAQAGLPTPRGLAARWAAYQAFRRQRNRIVQEMNEYTDQELAELGFDRHDIWAVANGRYRR